MYDLMLAAEHRIEEKASTEQDNYQFWLDNRPGADDPPMELTPGEVEEIEEYNRLVTLRISSLWTQEAHGWKHGYETYYVPDPDCNNFMSIEEVYPYWVTSI